MKKHDRKKDIEFKGDNFVGLKTCLRWKVTILYDGYDAKHFRVEELEELQEIVETGPPFNKIIDIIIKYAF